MVSITRRLLNPPAGGGGPLVFVEEAGGGGVGVAEPIWVFWGRGNPFLFATVGIEAETIQPAPYSGRTINHGVLYVPGLCMHRPMGATEISRQPVSEPSFEPWIS
jgi:hypothetical protein